jgi:hypothetical protein
VVNEIGAVFNVRIEGDTDANLFYTDATNDRVGVGTASPSVKLDVVGAVKASSNINVGGLFSGFGTTGVNGLEAAMMLTDDEYPPKPTKLRAFTMYE